MKLGVLQGRLSPPIGGFQEFPEDWEREFRIAELDLGLSHIDWLVTKNCSQQSNALFYCTLRGLPIGSICADNLIDKRIIEPSFLFNNLQPICDSAIKNNIDTITIPLLEESDVSDVTTRDKFITNINKFAITYYPELIFSFEIEAYEKVISDVINSNDNFRLTYDTGNMTSLGINHEYYIEKFINKIDTVHIKDRLFNGTTVYPGKGKTDFKSIFNNLRLLGDKGINYTLQTNRGKNEEEVNTISNHIKIVRELYG